MWSPWKLLFTEVVVSLLGYNQLQIKYQLVTRRCDQGGGGGETMLVKGWRGLGTVYRRSG